MGKLMWKLMEHLKHIHRHNFVELVVTISKNMPFRENCRHEETASCYPVSCVICRGIFKRILGNRKSFRNGQFVTMKMYRKYSLTVILESYKTIYANVISEIYEIDYANVL